MLTDPESKTDAIFTAAYVLPLVQSNWKIFVRSPVGTASAEMFPWRQSIAEHAASAQDACYSPSMGTHCVYFCSWWSAQRRHLPFFRNLTLLEISCWFPKENFKPCKLHKVETNKQTYKHFTQISHYSSGAWGNSKALYSWEPGFWVWALFAFQIYLFLDLKSNKYCCL